MQQIKLLHREKSRLWGNDTDNMGQYVEKKEIREPTRPKHSFDKRAKQLPILGHMLARQTQRFERHHLRRLKNISLRKIREVRDHRIAHGSKGKRVRYGEMMGRGVMNACANAP